MKSLFLVLGYNPNCLRRVYLYFCLSNQTKLVHEWERRKWTSTGARDFLSSPLHWNRRILPRDTVLSWLCLSSQKLFLIPNPGVIVEGAMKLLIHPRLLLGRNFMNKHHRQWVERKILEICLTSELWNQLAIIAEGFSVAPQSLGKKCLLLFHYFITAS